MFLELLEHLHHKATLVEELVDNQVLQHVVLEVVHGRHVLVLRDNGWPQRQLVELLQLRDRLLANVILNSPHFDVLYHLTQRYQAGKAVQVRVLPLV